MPAPDPRTVTDLRQLTDARPIFDALTARTGRRALPEFEPEPELEPAPAGPPDPGEDLGTITLRQERRRQLKTLAGVALMLLVLVVLPLLATQVDWPWSDTPSKPPPQWVTLPTLRASTSDGSGVKARVAIDVDSNDTQAMIQSRLQQVSVMLEVTLASQGRAKVTSPEGMQQLATDMRDRLNGYLAAEGVPPVKSVAIQDLVVSAP